MDLELETVNTTQDVAVAVAFLITEIVEFAMLNRPKTRSKSRYGGPAN